ncbi:RFC checkpoint protein Rad17 [Coniosporium tulheliwenetii]|uniref:RFC checkpoint protein Rad17 n=1 Tax=Coniosporium tulheliwenetii TaxID=3383036 RepID=A0ACC2ZL64_9PEZI|nr:RFC checkpoint protein Rad17 [Cladosporium sp. JES 115]
MVQPRQKKKTVIVLDSDDDEESSTQPAQPAKPPRPGRTLRSSAPGRTSRSRPSEKKPLAEASQASSATPPDTQAASQGGQLDTKSKPQGNKIYSFFNAATQRQRSQPSASPEKTTASIHETEEDLILDDSDEKQSRRANGHDGSLSLAIRKRVRDEAGEGAALDYRSSQLSSQKFLKTSKGAKRVTSDSSSVNQPPKDQRPWTEKYGPVSLDELAVHKKKVADVRAWLSNVLAGRDRKCLLVLKGAAGTGKTATVSLLAQELGAEINEWKNPVGSDYMAENFDSTSAQFEDFVNRSGKFGGLSFATDGVGLMEQYQETASQASSRQITLIEEFPNTFTRSSSALRSFRSTIQQYLSANSRSLDSLYTSDAQKESLTPIVMIISETLVSANTASADSFTAHRLLGPDILAHFGTTVIEFNAIAPTLMAKALELVVLKEARKSGRRKTPGPQVIKRLSEIGDVRSAVSSLEFLCLRGDEGDGWGSKVAFTKPKGAKGDVPLTKMEQESLEMVTQRESALGLFHAVGKVVYNKREGRPFVDSIPQPPAHLPQHARPNPPEVNVDTLIDELGTDIQTFVAALHENYVLSCQSTTDEDTIDSINGCIDALSDADLLSPDRFGSAKRPFLVSAGDTLHQDEMSFHTSVRGILFELPHPVKRIAPPAGLATQRGRGGSRDAFQMFYPTSLRLWRQKEEIEGRVEQWVSRAQSGQLLGPVRLRDRRQGAVAGGVETWRRTTTITEAANSTETPDASSAPLLIGSGSSAPREMLLERLPYMAFMYRSRPSIHSPDVIGEIEKVTLFTGIGLASEEPSEEEETNGAVEGLATDPPAGRVGVRQPAIRAVKRETSSLGVSGVTGIGETGLAGLVLSDDDIEDD